jgi:hypothetical protein
MVPLLLVSLLVTSAGAFAAKDTFKGSFSVQHDVLIDGKKLPAGEYDVKWEGTGPTTDVNIMQNGKVVASTTARIVTLKEKSPYDASEEIPDPKGTSTLVEIRFSGKTYALDFGPATANPAK